MFKKFYGYVEQKWWDKTSPEWFWNMMIEFCDLFTN